MFPQLRFRNLPTKRSNSRRGKLHCAASSSSDRLSLKFRRVGRWKVAAVCGTRYGLRTRVRDRTSSHCRGEHGVAMPVEDDLASPINKRADDHGGGALLSNSRNRGPNHCAKTD